MTMPRIGYVSVHPSLSRPADYRRFAGYAKLRGIEFEEAVWGEKYDLVVLGCQADITLWKDYTHGKVVYDLIDSYFSIPYSNLKGLFRGTAKFLTGQNLNLKLSYWESLRNICRHADAVVCTTEAQRAAILPYCDNTHVILDIHSEVVKKTKQSYQAHKPFKLVWEGLPSNLRQLESIRDALNIIARKHPVELHVVTDLEGPRHLGKFGKVCSLDTARKIFAGAQIHEWNKKTFSDIIVDCDAAIIPINLNDHFAAGKPANKLLLLWRMGMPVLVSGTAAYSRAMDDAGVPLVCKDSNDWVARLEDVICDQDTREQAGKAGQQYAESHYNAEQIVECWDRLFHSLGFDFAQEAKEALSESNAVLKELNIDRKVVSGFGAEWKHFDQGALSDSEREQIWNDYFNIFPWDKLPADGGVGADIGCGSGRWAQLVAPKVKTLHAIDPSEEALTVARQNLGGHGNVCFHLADTKNLPVEDNSLDFAYSLGVLHHIPDTDMAIRDISRKLKPGAPLLLYLYYAFDNRPWWFRLIWKASDAVRRMVSRQPFAIRYLASQLIALSVYWPMSRLANLLDYFRLLPETWPLSYYRDKSLYTMRTDALDRFGTSLEQRFTREQIKQMLEDNGFSDIVFSDALPYWCACGIKK